LPHPEWIARAGRQSWNPRHDGFERRVRQARAKGYRCHACGNPTEDLSAHWCLKHRDHIRKYGDPLAKHLPRKLLGRWICLASRYLKQVSALPGDHVARSQLNLARWWLRSQVSSAAGCETLSWRQGESHERRWKRHLSKVARHFAVDELIALAVEFYVAREVIPVNAAASDGHEKFQIARLILFSVSQQLPSWHTRPGEQERPGLRYMLHAGSKIQAGLGMFAGAAASAVRGQEWGGYPDLADRRPVSQSAATKAAQRRRGYGRIWGMRWEAAYPR
jgi:hypothetical protein